MARRGLGVEPLHSSIRISFTREGRRERITLDLKPTPANLKYASKVAADIRRDIEAGVFDAAAYSPVARRAVAAADRRRWGRRKKMSENQNVISVSHVEI